MASQKNDGVRSKRKRTTSHEQDPPLTLPQESEQVRATKLDGQKVNLCQRLGKSIEDLLVSCRNETFREQCLQILGAENGSDAGIKTRELAMKLKDSRQKTGKKKKNS